MAESISGGTLNVGALQPDLVLRQQANPAEVASKFQTLQQQMLNNRLLGQNVRQTEAQREAARASIGADGQFDPDLYATMLAKRGGSPEAVAFAQQQRLSAIQAETAKLTQAREALGLSAKEGELLGNSLLPAIQAAMKMGPNGQPIGMSAEEARKAVLDGIVLSGATRPEFLARAKAAVGQLGDDPLANLRMAMGWSLMTNPTPERIAALVGATELKDVGDAFYSVKTPGLTGEPQIVGEPIAKTRTLAEKTKLEPVYDPATGVTKSQPSGQIMGDMAPGARPTGNVEVQQAPGLGEPEQATRGVEQGRLWAQAAERGTANRGEIQNMRDLVGKFPSGPDAETFYKINARIAQFMGEKAPKYTKDSAANFEEFKKLSQRFVNMQSQSLGQGDAKLEASLRASPNEFMSKEGIVGVLALMEGLEDASVAKNAAWQKWVSSGRGPQTVGQFEAGWNSRYNPRVFQAVHMTEPQRANMLKNMTSEERQKFKADSEFAKRAGWIR